MYEVSATDGFAWIQQNNARNQFFYQTSQGKADSYKCSLPKGMNCVAEIIHLTVPSQRLEAERQILNRLGFQFTDLARMMVKKPEDLNFSTSDNHRIRQANRVDYDIIHMLFTDAFDELTDAIPVEEELCQYLSNGEIWVNEEITSQKILGCALFEPSGKRTWIRHVTVEKSMRGKGVAKELLQMYISQRAQDTEYSLWVKDTNEAAVSLYRKIGFEETKRQMDIWTITAQ